MTKAQEQYDFHMVLDAVWENLVDELELDPVLKDLEVRKVFRRSEIRDLREGHPTKTKKINALLELVRDGDHTKYEQFKRCLVDSGQENLVKTIEAAEKGEYKPTVMRKELNISSDEAKLLEGDDQPRPAGEENHPSGISKGASSPFLASTDSGYKHLPEENLHVSSRPLPVRQMLPSSVMIPSILACLCCFCPAGALAIYFANQSEKAAISGNMDRAWTMRNRAVCCVAVSVAAGIMSIVLYVFYK